MIAHKAASTGIACRSPRVALSSRPAAAALNKRSVVAHQKQPFDIEAIEEKLEQPSSAPVNSPTQSKLSSPQMQEV